MSISAPVSWGELLDKISILEIKSERISNPSALENIKKELSVLSLVRDENLPKDNEIGELTKKMKTVNEKLWDIEDDIRECERQKDFGEKFISLARSVYFTNDVRADIKKQINKALDSELVEEKSYAAY